MVFQMNFLLMYTSLSNIFLTVDQLTTVIFKQFFISVGTVGTKTEKYVN